MTPARDDAHAVTPLVNRLQKNARHLGRWARREGIEAWRVYDRDIPEYPYAVDRYGEWLCVQRFDGRREVDEEIVAVELAAIGRALDVAPARVVLKRRQRQRGAAQYEKLAAAGEPFVVTEGGLRFEVELRRYLDTGLFLDHRLTRAMVREMAAGARMLNLFAYTGSFSVYAAAGGAASTQSVDLSKTYQAWTARNLALNGFGDDPRHRLEAADVLAWLERAARARLRFELIVLDPPSFSNSKRMAASFDVQRDQRALIDACMQLLAADGTLVFSNNRQGFRLDAQIERRWACEAITARTVPEDFRRRRPHQCWLLRHA
ncbi:MAG: class I SAM-dependent methyltransferase [Gammaproteobacteria bacterium]